jgi:hypothetical protein
MAQSIKRQSIGSYGTNGFSGSAVFGQTIGQPFSTQIYSQTGVSFVPGFQQPLSYLKNARKKEVKNDAGMFLTGELDVFPNPARVNFTIQSSGLLEEALIKIMDINGRILIHKALPELSSYKVDCSSWQSGVYFISVTTPDAENNLNQKIIISK